MTEKPKVTPKDFFMWIGAMLALYVSVFSFLALFFEYIDKTFPDALNYYVDPYSTGMRLSIASLIVLFPLYMVLMRLIRSDMKTDPTRQDVWVRRWVLMLTIFVAGITIAVDLISLVNTFLGGEITTRFLMKVVLVFLVASIGLMHFLADIRGYWIQNPHYARRIGWAISALVVLTIGSGFFIMGTPGQIRLYRFDDQKVNDLQNIQYQIVNFWQSKQKLPASLGELPDPLQGNTIPVDPQNGSAYVYRVTADLTFALCATFNAETDDTSLTAQQTVPMYLNNGLPRGDVSESNWYHPMGQACFLRTIDPQLYPPINKNAPETVPTKIPQASTK